jgi:uncharacterized membrane protein
MLSRVKTFFRHRWLDASDARRALPAHAMQRLSQRVAASEQRHTGELRLCIEAGLPTSYLWPHVWQGHSMPSVMRLRALALFGKLRVWDTQHNNGVLIYVLLAERSMELVADRGLNGSVPPFVWQALLDRLATALLDGRFEAGLSLALDEVSTLLEQHFPAMPGVPRANELPDAPVLL